MPNAASLVQSFSAAWWCQVQELSWSLKNLGQSTCKSDNLAACSSPPCVTFFACAPGKQGHQNGVGVFGEAPCVENDACAFNVVMLVTIRTRAEHHRNRTRDTIRTGPAHHHNKSGTPLEQDRAHHQNRTRDTTPSEQDQGHHQNRTGTPLEQNITTRPGHHQNKTSEQDRDTIRCR